MITNPSGKIYVGSSKHIELRFKQYNRSIIKSQAKLSNSISKYGYSNHKFEIIKVCEENERLKYEREIGLSLNVLDKNIGLNLSLPNDGESPQVLSEEYKSKISKSLKGKTRPDEVRKKISAFQKTKKLRPETKEKIRQVRIGDKRSMETCKKISLAKLGSIPGNAKKVDCYDGENNLIKEFTSISKAAAYAGVERIKFLTMINKNKSISLEIEGIFKTFKLREINAS